MIGYRIYRNINLVATGVSVKGAPGKLFGWFLSNNNAAKAYIKFYNLAAAPTVGTTVPVMTIELPGSSAANVEFERGIDFSAGIGIGATTLVDDNDATAPAANQIVANVLYL